jgi:hypothetical protein
MLAAITLAAASAVVGVVTTATPAAADLGAGCVPIYFNGQLVELDCPGLQLVPLPQNDCPMCGIAVF